MRFLYERFMMVVRRLILLLPILLSTRTFGMSRSGDVLSLVPFLSLARELAALLLPVQPSPQFRADLERSLLAAAQQQNARFLRFPPPATFAGTRFDGFERRLVIGAAAAAAVGSAVSIAGIVVYVLYRRSDRAA
jgi:hypothetical protein